MPHIAAARTLAHNYATISQIAHAIQPLTRVLLSPTLTRPCATLTHELLCLALACLSALCLHARRASHSPAHCTTRSRTHCASCLRAHCAPPTHALAHAASYCLRPCHIVRFAAVPQPTRQTCLVSMLATSTPMLLPRLDTRPQAKPLALMTHGGDTYHHQPKLPHHEVDNEVVTSPHTNFSPNLIATRE